MNIFDLKITESNTFTVPLKIEVPVDPCVEPTYLFDLVEADPMEIGESVEVEVVGGISPFIWEMLSPGCSLDASTTIGRMNVVNCTYATGDGYVRYKVTDACGNVLEAAIALNDEFIDCGCTSGVCATYPTMQITGPTTDVVVGNQYVVTGGLAPYRYRVTGGAIDGTGTIQGFYWLTSQNIDITITAIDSCGNRVSMDAVRAIPDPLILNSWILAPNETVTYDYGCDDDPRFTISCGEIDRRTGLIKSLDGCECNQQVTVTVDDGCSDPVVDSKDNPDFSELIINGSDAPVVGDTYGVSGGALPVTFSFDGGTIDNETGEVLSITSCGGPNGNGAVGIVSALDSCGNTASLEVRLPGGHWFQDSIEFSNKYAGDFDGSRCFDAYSNSCGSVSEVCVDDYGFDSTAGGEYYGYKETISGELRLIEHAHIRRYTAYSANRNAPDCDRADVTQEPEDYYLSIVALIDAPQYQSGINGCPSRCVTNVYYVGVYRKTTYYWIC